MSTIISIFNYGLTALGIAAVVMAALRFVHMLQLEGYQANMYLKWLKKNMWRDWLPTVLVFLICLFIEAALPYIASALGERFSALYSPIIQASIRLIYVALMANIAYVWSKQSTKKPLVYTPRIKRMIVTIIILVIIINLVPGGIKYSQRKMGIYLLIRTFVYIPALILPLIVLLAHAIMFPIEELIKRSFLNQAKTKLEARTDLIKIGITGSYGKTSSKYALGTLLSEKFNTLITPQSYNTPMGITRVIREQLAEENQVFVAEMGARYVGDIEELCDLVSPQIGLLTSVGKQHMETFGAQENISNTKFELISALPADGAAFFNGDNSICKELSERNVAVRNKFIYGIDVRGDIYMRALNIKTSSNGSEFLLVAHDGQSALCTTKLLGKHNILNITGCAAVSYYLGLSMEQIAAGIAKLESVEHRLALINSGPITVIDDAFNSNPAGAKAALEVLRSFDGRKFIITPGMVELGAEEEAQNEDFGAEIACSVDYAILVGKKRAQPILRGMQKFDYPMENVFVVASLDEASAKLAELTVAGDVVLFENDLPDNYNE